MNSLQFLGATQTVTGSKFLIQVDSLRVPVDCGLFQGSKELRLRNWDRLPVDPSSIDVIEVIQNTIQLYLYIPRLKRTRRCV